MVITKVCGTFSTGSIPVGHPHPDFYIRFNMKRILIFSLSAGGGHLRAAEAIKKNILTADPTAVCEHFDIAPFLPSAIRKIVTDYYAFLTKTMPELYGFLFRKTNSGKNKYDLQKITNNLSAKNPKITALIKNFQPDKIICTHPLPANMILKMFPNLKVDTVITDFELHNWWIAEKTNHYFLATEKMRWKLTQKGIDEKKITVAGIPVDPIFFVEKDQNELRKKYSLKPEDKVILLLSGGQGFGKIDKLVNIIIERLTIPATLITIAGKNHKLETKINKIKPPKNFVLKTVGWTNEIDEYMRISDAIVTKPGGSTTAECLALGKKIIAVHPIPGQEEGNTWFILKNGFGDFAETEDDLIFYLLENLKNPSIKKPAVDAGRIIAEKIINE